MTRLKKGHAGLNSSLFMVEMQKVHPPLTFCESGEMSDL